MMLWDLWDPRHSNISRIPKFHNFREPTLELIIWFLLVTQVVLEIEDLGS
jgi:hypothetical protein